MLRRTLERPGVHSEAGPLTLEGIIESTISHDQDHLAQLRRLKAAAHEALPLAARPGWDYVLIARAGTCMRPYGQLVADVRKALSLTARGERADRERAQA